MSRVAAICASAAAAAAAKSTAAKGTAAASSSSNSKTPPSSKKTPVSLLVQALGAAEGLQKRLYEVLGELFAGAELKRGPVDVVVAPPEMLSSHPRASAGEPVEVSQLRVGTT
jgi:hypothetical protein